MLLHEPSRRSRQGWNAWMVCLSSSSWIIIVSCCCFACVEASLASSTYYCSPSSASAFKSTRTLYNQMLEIRGGDSAKKKKKNKKGIKKDSNPVMSSEESSSASINNQKAQINQVLKETDAAQALGDAIRARADVLRQEDTLTSAFSQNPFLNHLNRSITSLSWSLGASDYTTRATTSSTGSASPAGSTIRLEDDDEDSGGVEVSPSAVVASYFLKSHGGAHALQSLCSLLAATAGMGSIGLAGRQRGEGQSSSLANMSLTLLKRACVFALIKHVSGLVAASFLTAKAIPDVGFYKARAWIQQVARDPVSQYCFYSALVLVWLPATPTTSSAASTTTTTTATPSCWWQSYPIITFFLVGPIVLREVISTALVLCDVLVLLACSSSTRDSDYDGGGGAWSRRFLQASSALVNAIFSILVTPRVWRNATASQRQEVLAKLVQKCSLALEVAVGALFVLDAVRGAMEFLFAAQEQRPGWGSVVKRSICANLYLQFLLTRRRKIQRLAAQLRGGAAHVPSYILDVLLDPRTAMGLDLDDRSSDSYNAGSAARTKEAKDTTLTWRDYLWMVFELD